MHDSYDCAKRVDRYCIETECCGSASQSVNKTKFNEFHVGEIVHVNLTAHCLTRAPPSPMKNRSFSLSRNKKINSKPFNEKR